MKFQTAGAAPATEYRVAEQGGCIIVFGALPAEAFSMFAKRLGKGAIVDTDLARMAQADFAFGSRRDCEALRAKLAGPAHNRVAREHPELPEHAARWLANGERGASSDAIFYQLTGIETGSKTNFPMDVADFRRCRLLLEQAPSFQAGFKSTMRNVSRIWAGLIDNWDKLCDTMDTEAPDWRQGKRCSAGLTYGMLRRIVAEEDPS